jgi:hypothetical protein
VELKVVVFNLPLASLSHCALPLLPVPATAVQTHGGVRTSEGGQTQHAYKLKMQFSDAFQSLFRAGEGK